MNGVVPSRKATKKPWHRWIFWPVMVLLLATIMGLTMVKDFHLTGDQPNVFFYILMPLVSMLGGTLAGFGAARAFKQAVTFVDMLAILFIATFIGQVYENISKLIWYLVWDYPGWLWLLFTFLLALFVVGYSLMHWLGMRWSTALALAVIVYVGGVLSGLLFTSVTGVTTPGS